MVFRAWVTTPSHGVWLTWPLFSVSTLNLFCVTTWPFVPWACEYRSSLCCSLLLAWLLRSQQFHIVSDKWVGHGKDPRQVLEIALDPELNVKLPSTFGCSFSHAELHEACTQISSAWLFLSPTMKIRAVQHKDTSIYNLKSALMPNPFITIETKLLWCQGELSYE